MDRDGVGGKRDERDGEEGEVTSEVDDGGEEQTLIIGQGLSSGKSHALNPSSPSQCQHHVSSALAPDTCLF